jgi:hypothetical protein
VPIKGLDLDKLFVELEETKHRYGVKEWGISQTSLEDVFISIVDDKKTPVD